MPNLLTRLKINEVSSVNRGAGEGVKIVMMKRLGDDKAPSAATAVATIMRKAIDLGADEVKVTTAAGAMAKAVNNAETNLAEADQAAAVEKSLAQCVDYLTGLVPAEKRDDFLAASAAIPTVKGDEPMTTEEKARMDALEKSNKELMGTVSKLALEKAVDKLPTDQAEYVAKKLKKADGTADDEAIAAFVKMTDEEKAKKLAEAKAEDERAAGNFDKSIDSAIASHPLLKAMQTENSVLVQKLSVFEKADEVTAFAKRATDLGLPAEHGEVMRKAYGGDKEAIAKHELLLKALRSQVDTGALFKEFGTSETRVATNAYAEIRAKAEELKKSELGKGLSIHQCVNKVMTDPANAELVARNKTESLKKMGAIAA